MMEPTSESQKPGTNDKLSSSPLSSTSLSTRRQKDQSLQVSILTKTVMILVETSCGLFVFAAQSCYTFIRCCCCCCFSKRKEQEARLKQVAALTSKINSSRRQRSLSSSSFLCRCFLSCPCVSIYSSAGGRRRRYSLS